VVEDSPPIERPVDLCHAFSSFSAFKPVELGLDVLVVDGASRIGRFDDHSPATEARPGIPEARCAMICR